MINKKVSKIINNNLTTVQKYQLSTKMKNWVPISKIISCTTYEKNLLQNNSAK